MAITFPLSMPDFGIHTMPMDLDRVSAKVASRASEISRIEIAPSLWKTTIETRVLVGTEYDYWRSWLSTINNYGRFYLWDANHRFPSYYKTGFGTMNRAVGGAFDGTCRVVNVNSLNASEITLDYLPIGFVLTHGDYLAFDYDSGTKRALHRVLLGGGGVSNASGFVTLTVEPPVVPGWVATTTVTLEKASAVAIPVDPTTSDYGAASVGSTKQVIRFSAIQSIWK